LTFAASQVGAIAQFGSIFPLFMIGMQFHIKDYAYAVPTASVCVLL
jgi:hypothetical protein